MRMWIHRAVVSLVALACSPWPAFAQSGYPNRDIHLVVGYAAGSGPDITTRRLADALRTVRARTLLIAFSSDWLYPPGDSEELGAALRAAGRDVRVEIIDAPYGHDCFLLEEARQTPIIREFLGQYPAR